MSKDHPRQSNINIFVSSQAQEQNALIAQSQSQSKQQHVFVDEESLGDIRSSSSISSYKKKNVYQKLKHLVIGQLTCKYKNKQLKVGPATFLTSSIAVSLITHKIATLCFDDASHIAFSQGRSYVSLLGFFLSDVFFLLWVSIALNFTNAYSSQLMLKLKQQEPGGVTRLSVQFKNFKLSSKVSIGIVSIMSFLAFFISALETKSLMTKGQRIPWAMTLMAIKQWDQFKGMIQSSIDDGRVKIWMICLFQILMTAILMRIRRTVCMASPPSLLGRRALRHRRVFPMLVCMGQSVMAQFQYEKSSDTLMISVPMQILSGMHDMNTDYGATMNDNMFDAAGIVDTDTGKHIGQIKHTEPRPLNVVLILLETMRADFFPFDGTTLWAKEHIPHEAEHLTKTLTPFYTKWVEHPSTLFFPRITSAGGTSHKSQVCTMCSMHALQRKTTPESKSKLYHQCLPRILEMSGYGYKNHQFFKALTKTFDNQDALARNLGFENMYAKEDYLREYNPGSAWNKAHEANYFGLVDKPFIDPMMRWVDNSRNSSLNNMNVTENAKTDEPEPFFLSYLSAVTHHPYGCPPETAPWKKKDFVKDNEINSFLNGVAYTDEFLKELLVQFENRNLMKSTLFVMIGDHGLNFHNRGEKAFDTLNAYKEEGFDVGVSFHTEHEGVAKRLAQVRDSGIIQSGTWSSIDVLPTILELLNLFDDNDAPKFDGRSMLHPSGRRLLMSISNPGDIMILRDKSYVLAFFDTSGKRAPEVFDLERDPEQRTPVYLHDESRDFNELTHWGKQALKFAKLLKIDLDIAHRDGHRCTNCTLSLLNSLESLDQWDEYESAL